MQSLVETVLDGIVASLEDEQHKQEAKDNKDLFEKYISVIHSEAWKLSVESDDKTVQSYYGETDEGKVMAKGVGHFPFKPSKVQHFYNKTENRPLFDSEFLE